MDKNKQIWVAPDELLQLDRAYLVEELEGQESSLLDDNNELSDKNYTALYHEINGRVWEFLMDCCSKVEEQLERDKRNLKAHLANPHYRVYWKNDGGINSKEFSLVGCYISLSDAINEINEWDKNDNDQHKILEFKNGIEAKDNLYHPTLF